MPSDDFNKFAWYWSLAAATDLSDTEFRVLVLLANYADGKTGKRAYPSAATLAEQMGKSDKTVRRALAALVAKGRLIKTDRPGASAEYQLVTLDTQTSRVTDGHPGHLDVQGPDDTLDKSDPTLDTQVSTLLGHLDVHRSDQSTDPDTRSGSGSDQFRAGDIPEGDVQPGENQDDTGHEGRCLAVEGRGPEGLVGLHPRTGSPFDDPFSPESLKQQAELAAEAAARQKRIERHLQPATAATTWPHGDPWV